jgi:hypothetical protein
MSNLFLSFDFLSFERVHLNFTTSGEMSSSCSQSIGQDNFRYVKFYVDGASMAQSSELTHDKYACERFTGTPISSNREC